MTPTEAVPVTEGKGKTPRTYALADKVEALAKTQSNNVDRRR